ncbi:MAG TPA: tetratricopeptide repeat protein [Usitatibacter sp.]
MTTALVLLLSLAAPLPAGATLTGGARLAAVYDEILAARFDQADRRLKDACPPAPEEACLALRAVSVWWQILLNPQSRRLDDRLNERADAAIAAADAWTRREPQRAEAWFYLAGSYAPRVNWRVLRGERLAAARDGNRIRTALERALQLDPGLNDAYFGIGLYHYYADVAPAAAKILRFLLLLPGGDRVEGLREMRRARERGELFTGEADYQLHLLYLWYEQKPAEARDLLRDLDKRYPTNPLFLEHLALVEDEYFHDQPASAARWRELADRARAGRVSDAPAAEARARLGLARALDAMYETDRAVDQLKMVGQLKLGDDAQAPWRAQAQLLLGRAHDRLGDHTSAVAAYTEAASLAPDSATDIREQARTGLRHAPNPQAAEAYRLSLEGWRALERRDLESAEVSLARAVELAPRDVVARYRYARVLEARKQDAPARDALQQVIAAPMVPAIVLASALVDYAQMIERDGDRARALALYRDASRVVGAEPRARDLAARAIKRLAPDGAPQSKVF